MQKGVRQLEMYRQFDTQLDKYTGIQTARHLDRQKDGQAERLTDSLTYI